MPGDLLKGLKRAVKGALWSGRLNSRWWISQPLDVFVFCGSSLSPPTNPPPPIPLSPLPPYFSHPDYSISIPYMLLPLCPTHFPDFRPVQSSSPPGSGGPLARGNRTWTAEDTGHWLKQWKNEKRQNNANPGRAFVTLAPGPLCKRGAGQGRRDGIFLGLQQWMMRKGDAEGRGGRVVGLGQGLSKKVE